jgi:hypothetical protein
VEETGVPGKNHLPATTVNIFNQTKSFLQEKCSLHKKNIKEYLGTPPLYRRFSEKVAKLGQ